MWLLLLASCAWITQRQVRVEAERGSLGDALTQACGAWYEAERDTWTFHGGRTPWEVKPEPNFNDSNAAWGFRPWPKAGYRAHDLRAWLRPALQGQLGVQAWSVDALHDEICPGGEPARFCGPPTRAPFTYDRGQVFIEVTTEGLRASGVDAVALLGAAMTLDGETYISAPRLPYTPTFRDRSHDKAAYDDLPPYPRGKPGKAGAPKGLGFFFETLLTGGLNIVIRGAAGTMNATPAEPVKVPEDHPRRLAWAEEEAVLAREAAFYDRVMTPSCEGERCRVGAHLDRDPTLRRSERPDALHLVLEARWGDCRLLDHVQLPLREGDALSERLDGLSATLPDTTLWPERVHL